MKLQKRSKLEVRAKENTSISRNKEEVKAGTPLDRATQHNIPFPSRTVGIAKGVTKNMGDFESYRVDVWLTDYVHDDETVEEAYSRVESIVDKTLEDAVFSVVEQ